MKKTVLCIVCMLMSIGVMAQMSTKISAKLAKGSFATYLTTSETTIGTPLGNSPIKSTASTEVKYSVTEVLPEGYTIEATALNIEGDFLNLSGAETEAKFLNDFFKSWIGKKFILSTDKDLKVLAIKNYDELKTEFTKSAEELIKNLPAEGGEGRAITNEALKKVIDSQMTEEKMISTINGKLFDFYGKTISTGMMEDVEIEGMKAKNTYVVSAPKNSDVCTINCTTVLAMTKDDLKAMLYKQLGDNLPEDQIEAMKPQIDQMLESGMVKIDGKGQSTFVFKKNGWLQSMESTMAIDAMGSKTEIVSKSTLKESK